MTHNSAAKLRIRWNLAFRRSMTYRNPVITSTPELNWFEERHVGNHQVSHILSAIISVHLCHPRSIRGEAEPPGASVQGEHHLGTSCHAPRSWAFISLQSGSFRCTRAQKAREWFMCLVWHNSWTRT
jgi:hypothetical protein